MVLCSAKVPRFLGPHVYTKAPDGGWGWMVALSFFMVEVFTYGTIKSFGIFFDVLMLEFEETNSRVAWIVSICVFVMTVNGPISSVLTTRFGFQPVVMTGGFLISVGTIATSFTTSVSQMYITYGLVAGFGYCLTFLPTLTILSQYFSRRRSLVTAFASIGESLAMFAMPPVFSILRDQIGWRHTMIVIGALQSTLIINGALLRPIIIEPGPSQDTDGPPSKKVLRVQTSIEDPADEDISMACLPSSCNLDDELARSSVSTGDSGVQSLKGADAPEERTLLNKEGGSEGERTKGETAEAGSENSPAKTCKLLDFSILKECNFILYCLFGLFATLGFFAPQLYIISLSVSRGVEAKRAAYMLSIMAVAEIFGRFSIGWVLTREVFRTRKLLVLLACVVMMALDLLGFTLVTEFYGLAACCAVYGFFMGTLACTHIPMLAEDDVVGIERMSSAAGVYVFIQSFAGLAGPPLGGVLVDMTDNYGSAFYTCAAGMALSALFLGLVKPAKTGLLCCNRKPKHKPEEAGEHKEELKEDQGGEDKVNNGEHTVNNGEHTPQDCSKAEVRSVPNGGAAGEDVRFS